LSSGNLARIEQKRARINLVIITAVR